jgi:hypothetical protein
MLQLALLNRVPFGKFNRASAFPVACCGVSERTTIKWIHSLHFEDSLQPAAGSFNSAAGSYSSIRLFVKSLKSFKTKDCGCLPATLSFARRAGKAAPTEDFSSVLRLLPSFHPLLEQLSCAFESFVATSYPALPL